MYSTRTGSVTLSVLLVIVVLFVVDVNCIDPSTKIDFDGDGRTDISVYRHGRISIRDLGTSFFYYLESSSKKYISFKWGTALDVPAPADYDNDGKTDVAIFRWWEDEYPYEASDYWISKSSSGRESRASVVYFYGYGIQQNANYYGDGGAELAVWRAIDVDLEPYPSDCWIPGFFINTGAQVVRKDVFNNCLDGSIAIDPAVGDYDNDGKSDVAAFFRPVDDPTAGYFHVWYGLTPYAEPDMTEPLNVDFPIPGDYDGDGRTDFAGGKIDGGSLIWRFKRSSDGEVVDLPFGLSTDHVVPGDYDGDGKTDIAVFRPEKTMWYIWNSSDKSVTCETYGVPTDMPLSRPNSLFYSSCCW